MIKTGRRGGQQILEFDDICLFIMVVEFYVSACVASKEAIFHPRS
jgi:hypothetical protein